MRANKSVIVLGIFTAMVAVILFIVCANATGGYSANWLPYAVALAVIVPYWVWIEQRHLIHQKQFSAQLQGLSDCLNLYLTMPAGRDSNLQPYINGKIIPISRFSNDPQLVRPNSIQKDIYRDLSEDLRATNDEQVGTIVWIDLEKQDQVGQAPLQTIGKCRVTIIDRVRSMIVGEMTFESRDARYKMPAVTEFGMSFEDPALGWYSPLGPEILGYLEKLPRK